MSKACGRCKQPKPFSDFHKHNGLKSGFQSWCKVCIAFRQANKSERVLNKPTATEKWCNRCKQYKVFASFGKHKTLPLGLTHWCSVCITQSNATTYLDNNRKWHHNYYQAHKAQHQANGRKWKQANPDKVRNNSATYGAVRQERIRNCAINDVTPDEWSDRLAEFNFHCAYCLKPLIEVHLEHMKAISRGGNHTISNIVPSCRSCNLKKGTKSFLAFMAQELGAPLLTSQSQAA